MKTLLSRRFLAIITLLIVVLFGFVVFQLQMLPFEYFCILMAVLVLLVFLLYKGEKDKHDRHPIRVALLKLVQVILSIALVIVSITLLKGSDLLSKMTGGKEQTIEFDVVVFNDSPYQSLSDLEGKVFGANTSVDAINMNKTKVMIEDKIGEIVLDEYSDHQESVNALKNNEIDAMIIKAIDLESLDDIEEDFSEKVRVIERFEIKLPSVEANSAAVTKEPFSVLISGTDKKGAINTFALSDVNMVATVNPTTKQILLVSIPRDYYIDLVTEGTELEGTEGKDKLTHSAKGGITCTIKTIENMLDMEMNYYAKFNFTSFLNVIDALGGVSVDIPKYKVIGNDEGVFVTKKGNYTMRPGVMEMDANQALCFVRERKAFVEGDAVRGKNQMIMLKAIIKKCCSPSIITKMDGVFEALSDSFETNMLDTDIKSLINMQIDDMSSWDIISYSLTGDSSHRALHLATVGDVTKVNKNGLYVTEPDYDAIDTARSYIETMMNNELLKVEE